MWTRGKLTKENTLYFGFDIDDKVSLCTKQAIKELRMTAEWPGHYDNCRCLRPNPPPSFLVSLKESDKSIQTENLIAAGTKTIRYYYIRHHYLKKIVMKLLKLRQLFRARFGSKEGSLFLIVEVSVVSDHHRGSKQQGKAVFLLFARSSVWQSWNQATKLNWNMLLSSMSNSYFIETRNVLVKEKKM